MCAMLTILVIRKRCLMHSHLMKETVRCICEAHIKRCILSETHKMFFCKEWRKKRKRNTEFFLQIILHLEGEGEGEGEGEWAFIDAINATTDS